MNLRDFLRHREVELMTELAELHERSAQLEEDLTCYRNALAALLPAEPANNSGSPAPPAPSSIKFDIREMLNQGEREASTQINQLRGEIATRERELAEVRQSKGIIGIAELFEGARAAVAGFQRLTAAASDAQKRIAAALEVPIEMRKRLADALQTQNIPNLDLPKLAPPEIVAPSAPYAHLTMKQLVVKALDEHFPQGATARQLIEFFRFAWDRQIERTNLSPQLSRLYHEGTIGRVDGTKEWYLVPENRRGRRPYRLLCPVVDTDADGNVEKLVHGVGDVVYLLPDQVIEGVHEPLGDPTPDPNPDED